MEKSNSTFLCTPATATCEMYDVAKGCYPCSWPRIGANCTKFWRDTSAPHAVVASLLYAFIGLVFTYMFVQRLWISRKYLKSWSNWRTIDMVWSITSFSAFLMLPRFLMKMMYSEVPPQAVLYNLCDICSTLCLINVEILMVTEWVSIMRVKGRTNTKSKNLLHTQRGAILLLWGVSLFSAIMEQAIVPKEGEPGPQNLPLALTGGGLFDFKGTYNTRWNALKNLNHGLIGLVYSAVALVAGRKITSQLKNSSSESAKKAVKTLNEYLIGATFCVTLDLAYAVTTASSRLSQEWYFDYPPCSALSEYLYTADILKLFIFLVIFYLTRHSKRTERVEKKNSTGSSFSRSSGVGLSTVEDVSMMPSTEASKPSSNSNSDETTILNQEMTSTYVAGSMEAENVTKKMTRDSENP